MKPHFFEIFNDQKIIHCFSTRIGGNSGGFFESLNLGLSTPDNINTVKKNREAFFEYLGIDNRQVAIPQQIHSANIEIVTKPDLYKNTDALLTKKAGVILSIQTADCFPVFIFDPQEGACGIVHSGWRGTSQNIAGKTIEKMKNELNCQPQNILIGIGAGIQQKNYQVDLNTATNFETTFLCKDGEYHFKLDIQGKIIDQLKKTGINSHNIEIDTRCTFDEQDLFYSYRRDGLNSGRMMGIIGLL